MSRLMLAIHHPSPINSEEPVHPEGIKVKLAPPSSLTFPHKQELGEIQVRHGHTGSLLLTGCFSENIDFTAISEIKVSMILTKCFYSHV